MIVISTPTGQIGRQTLDKVIDSGEPIRVIARAPSRLPQAVRERVEVVEGSMEDVDVVDQALVGADCVLWVVPPGPTADSIPGHVLGFAGPLCEAIGRQGVERVVAVSSLGRGVARNAGQVSAIFALDHLVESTGVDYRALCPPGFMENMLHQAGSIASQGTFFSPIPADRKLPTCATRDIAAVAAELLLDRSWSGQESIPLRGPEDLSPDEMAEIIGDAIGRPVRFQRISADAYKATLVELGMSEAWAQGLVQMSAAAEGGIYDAESHVPAYPTPTTFRQWCEDTLRPAMSAAA
jgi:uncharacterized protein YbjT (DUF2867 family)